MNAAYTISLLVTTCICLAIVIVAFNRRTAPGASGLMLFMLSCSVWAGTYAIRWAVSETSAQLFWLDATYFGVVFNATFLLIFGLQFTGRSHLLTRRNLALSAIVPLVTLLLLWTDGWHGLFFGGQHTTGTILSGGSWFWFFVLYSYTLIFILIALFIQAYLRASSLYRLQTAAVLFAGCLPVAGNILSFAGISPFPNLDLTPFIFTASGLIYFYALFGLRLLDIVPIARHKLVDEMIDGVIVLDANQRIVDVNPAVLRLIGVSDSVIGKASEDVLNMRLHLGQASIPHMPRLTELRVSEKPLCDIELHVLPLLNERQKISGYLLILHEITKSKQTAEALVKSEALYRQAIEVAGAVPYYESYYNEGKSIHYDFIGEGIRQITGYGPEEFSAKVWDSLVEEVNLVENLAGYSLEEGIKRVRSGEDLIWKCEHRIRDRAGKIHWVFEAAVELRNEQGVAYGSIGTYQDITARKQGEEEIRELNANLEKRVQERTVELVHANRVKDEFLAMVSHELRTPLNSVLGLSETLLEGLRGELNERQEIAVQMIRSSGEHLLGVINDVLDISKIQAENFFFQSEKVDVHEICKTALEFITHLALQKSIEVEYISPEIGCTAIADPKRLKQILVNLLSNAVKFTPKGGKVKLEVTTDAQAKRIRFSVTDSGIGISAEDLPKLFQPFVQVDSKLSRQYEGTGLGLVLVKKLVEMHGGSIEVRSDVGAGSCFTFFLPWEHQDKKYLQGQVVENEQYKTKSPIHAKIMIADDDKATIMLVQDYLEYYGYQVFAAMDGGQVIPKMEEVMPDVILMDIQMPHANGLELTRCLRSDPRFATIPIIALTAFAMSGDEELCLEAGMNEYLSKPVSLRELKKLIEKLLLHSHK